MSSLQNSLVLVGTNAALKIAGPEQSASDAQQEVNIMHTLPELPYPRDALEPHISWETLDYHYGKHHRAYVNKLNELVKGTGYENASLEEIIRATRPASGHSSPVYNNAAQAWNHAFYWQCLTPQQGSPQTGLQRALSAAFGSVDDFQQQFSRAAVGTFGSGWAWLVTGKDRGLEIITTGNADNPLAGDRMPLLTCDVWEHAYYIDYRNARAEYLDAFWKMINWDFVAERYGQLHESSNAA
jgi:Fe-Mn family superoxide dismutase